MENYTRTFFERNPSIRIVGQSESSPYYGAYTDQIKRFGSRSNNGFLGFLRPAPPPTAEIVVAAAMFSLPIVEKSFVDMVRSEVLEKAKKDWTSNYNIEILGEYSAESMLDAVCKDVIVNMQWKAVGPIGISLPERLYSDPATALEKSNSAALEIRVITFPNDRSKTRIYVVYRVGSDRFVLTYYDVLF
jgi:hypothetical protein